MTTATSTVTLGFLIEETLQALYRDAERPLQFNLGTGGINNSQTSVPLSSAASVNIGDVVEVGMERMRVTDTLTTAPPSPHTTLTVVRGYAGTPKATAVEGAVVLLNPLWGRYDVKRAIMRSFGSIRVQVPLTKAEQYLPVSGKNYAVMPADTLDVVSVGFLGDTWMELPGWDYRDGLPTSLVATGKIVTLPQMVAEADQVTITRRVPYVWTDVSAGDGSTTDDPAEDDTIEVPLDGEDLPSLYAAAYRVARREITRIELDRVEEWNQEAAIRQGVNVRMVQMFWQTFYQRLDEVHRLYPTRIVRRPFRKMPRL